MLLLMYHYLVKICIVEAWKLARDIQSILGWICYVDNGGPDEVEFVDNDARHAWAQFIERAKKKRGGPGWKYFTPDGVLIYLGEQSARVRSLQWVSSIDYPSFEDASALESDTMW